MYKKYFFLPSWCELTINKIQQNVIFTIFFLTNQFKVFYCLAFFRLTTANLAYAYWTWTNAGCRSVVEREHSARLTCRRATSNLLNNIIYLHLLLCFDTLEKCLPMSRFDAIRTHCFIHTSRWRATVLMRSSIF